MDSTERRAEVTWNAALRAGAAARLHTQERAPVGMALAARVTAAAARVMAASRRRRRRELDRRATDRTRAGRPATAKMATAASRRAGVTLLRLLHEKRRRLRAGRADTTRGRSTPSSSRVPRLRRPFHRPTIRSANLCARRSCVGTRLTGTSCFTLAGRRLRLHGAGRVPRLRLRRRL